MTGVTKVVLKTAGLESLDQAIRDIASVRPPGVLCLIGSGDVPATSHWADGMAERLEQGPFISCFVSAEQCVDQELNLLLACDLRYLPDNCTVYISDECEVSAGFVDRLWRALPSAAVGHLLLANHTYEGRDLIGWGAAHRGGVAEGAQACEKVLARCGDRLRLAREVLVRGRGLGTEQARMLELDLAHLLDADRHVRTTVLEERRFPRI